MLTNGRLPDCATISSRRCSSQRHGCLRPEWAGRQGPPRSSPIPAQTINEKQYLDSGRDRACEGRQPAAPDSTIANRCRARAACTDLQSRGENISPPNRSPPVRSARPNDLRTVCGVWGPFATRTRLEPSAKGDRVPRAEHPEDQSADGEGQDRSGAEGAAPVPDSPLLIHGRIHRDPLQQRGDDQGPEPRREEGQAEAPPDCVDGRAVHHHLRRMGSTSSPNMTGSSVYLRNMESFSRFRKASRSRVSVRRTTG